HITFAALRQHRLEILEKKRVLAPARLDHERFDPLPYGNGAAADRRQHVLIANELVANEAADAIVKAAHAMKRALGTLTAAVGDELLPGGCREFVQQKKLIILEFGTLP